MTIHIEISGETEQRLRWLAAERGLSLDEYAREVLEQGVSPNAATAEQEARQGVESRRNTIGKFAHLGLSVSREAIEEARREMWANFPRQVQKSPQS